MFRIRQRSGNGLLLGRRFYAFAKLSDGCRKRFTFGSDSNNDTFKQPDDAVAMQTLMKYRTGIRYASAFAMLTFAPASAALRRRCAMIGASFRAFDPDQEYGVR